MNLFLQITSISYHLDYQHLKRNAISLAHSDGLSLTYSTKTSHPSKEKERATATRRDKQGMATHVAHDVFGYGLQVGKDALTYGKSKPGVVKWTVEKVSGPVCSVLESKIGQTAIKAGDRVISVADGTIDKAMNTGAYKSTSRLVKTTYSSRVLPATEKVKSTVASTTAAVKTTYSTRVTTPMANAYNGSLAFADKTVEYMLPETDASFASDDKKLPKSVVGLTCKITRRSVRKVAATRKMVVATATYTLEQGRPSNIKKNSVVLYTKALTGADSLVDTYLPDKDGVEGKTTVKLLRKFAKRGRMHTIATIKKCATAVKNSPATFKKSVVAVYNKLSEQAMKLKNLKIKIKFMTLKDLTAKATPMFEAMQARGGVYVTAADKMLLKYKHTASLRNMGVSFYASKLAHIVNPLLTKYLPAAKAVAPTPKTIKSAVPTLAPDPVVEPVVQPVAEPVAEAVRAPIVQPAPECTEYDAPKTSEFAEKVEKKKKRDSKKAQTSSASPPAQLQNFAEQETM